MHWAITSHLGISQAEASRRLEVKPSQLSRWINDPTRPPNEESLDRIAKLTGISRAWLRYGDSGEVREGAAPTMHARAHISAAGGRVPEETQPPAPNYAGLGIELPGLDLLQPGARVAFDRAMLALIGEGCGRAALERAGQTLLASIVAGGIHGEADQLATLQALIAVARRVAGEMAPIAPAAGATAADSLDVLQRLGESQERREDRPAGRAAPDDRRRSG